MPSLPQERVIQGPSPLDLNTELPYQSTMKRKIRKKKKKGTITANVAGTKFEIVRLVIDEMGFMKTPDEDETSNLIWCDSAVQQEKIAELQNYQRINHFPGMGEICRKDFLARNMTKMIKSRPLDYTFVPRTWIFPAEYMQFQNYMKELKKKRKQKTFIVKPANGAMGHGISLIRNGDKLPSQDHLIVQEYIEKPFLMEGYKFDLRIYILVTSCDPLKIFLYHDGLVRMGTEKYIPPNESNLINDLGKILESISDHSFNIFFKEEDILDLLEQCEIDDEKLMGKTAKPRGPKPLSSMPESSEVMKRQKYYSSDSSYDSSRSASESEDNENEEYQNKNREKQVTYNLKQSNNYKLIQQSSSIRRSVSCPRSISSQSPSSADSRPFSAQQVIPASRPTSGSRSHSLNRASSYMRHLPHTNDASSPNSQMSESLRQLRTKEQEDDLTSQTLFVLKDMKIRFPGKSDAESLLLIEDIIDNWKYHKTKVASYWLIKLDSVKQRKVSNAKK
ncbi:tubulin polyglutamylase TTLL7 [Leptonychotes weddellii]|uniref:Tubulin polyglutamylase TTLL7 n=1 Tax=Leptonychotes weddellii TaxID=9713 RepID=A0A7F8R314_LEPWE|nr:tubulin polyglutamylase TTLL7 [Leptonychotes weddellii]